MKLLIKKTSYLALSIVLLISLTSGHHFETRLAQENPMYDMTDLYCFPSSNPNTTTFIMDFNPEASVDSSFFKNFGNKKGYRQLHIGFQTDLNTGFSLGFSFSNNKLNVYSTPSANPKLGELGKKIGKAKLYQTTVLKNGIKLWAGIVKDPFNGNGDALYRMKQNVAKGEWDDAVFSSDTGNDKFNNAHVVAIVMDIPNEMLNEQIYYHATSAAKLKGTEEDHDHAHWHRINRIGHVLLPHLYMETMSDREVQNAGNIADDVNRRANCQRMLETYTTLAKSQENPKAYADAMTKLLLPDYIPYKVGTAASYTMPNINGRKLSDNAMDTALEILVGKPFPNYTKVKTTKFTNEFPYLKAVN